MLSLSKHLLISKQPFDKLRVTLTKSISLQSGLINNLLCYQLRQPPYKLHITLVNLLSFGKIALFLAKNGRQSPVPAKSKKQKHNVGNGNTKPKTQWFCVQICSSFHLEVANKTKCHCFFDEREIVRRHIAGLTGIFVNF